jgi:DMSO/TMAO reductase YedYZ heme-binding membrane subunit
MKLSPFFRTLAIVSYLFIFLQGMIIAIPFGCMLFVGLFEAEPLTRIFIILADIALLTLFILSLISELKVIIDRTACLLSTAVAFD